MKYKYTRNNRNPGDYNNLMNSIFKLNHQKNRYIILAPLMVFLFDHDIHLYQLNIQISLAYYEIVVPQLPSRNS